MSPGPCLATDSTRPRFFGATACSAMKERRSGAGVNHSEPTQPFSKHAVRKRTPTRRCWKRPTPPWRDPRPYLRAWNPLTPPVLEAEPPRSGRVEPLSPATLPGRVRSGAPQRVPGNHLNRPPYSIRFPPGSSQDTVRSAAAPHRNYPPEGSSRRQVRTAPRERRQGECGSYRYRRVPPPDRGNRARPGSRGSLLWS